MKTQLIYFDSFENSMKGMSRGLIAFITLIIFDLIRFSLMKITNKNNNVPKNIYSMILVYLILCSAIGVQLASKYSEALVFGCLIGLVVYGVLNFYNLSFNNEDLDSIPRISNLPNFINILINVFLGVISCGIASSIVYIISHNQ